MNKFLMFTLMATASMASAHAQTASYLECTSTINWNAADSNATDGSIHTTNTGNSPSLPNAVSLKTEVTNAIAHRFGVPGGPSLSQLTDRGLSFTAETTQIQNMIPMPPPGVKITVTSGNNTQYQVNSVQLPGNNVSEKASMTVISGGITWTIECESNLIH